MNVQKTICVITTIGTATLLAGWFSLPGREQTLDLASVVHLNVQKTRGDNAEVRLYGNRAEYSLNTSLHNVSGHLIDAIVASEDHRFFQRSWMYLPGKFLQAGIACVQNVFDVREADRCAGNSTITQQVAKLLWVAHDRSVLRKTKELFWAIKMELQLSKEEILQIYLNRIPLGASVYGVEMASRAYFAKPASSLTLQEAAIIAASVRSPGINLHMSKQATITRANLVLNTMYRHGFIDVMEILSGDMRISKGWLRVKKPYIGHLWSWIKPEVVSQLANAPAGFYKVYTSLNAEVQIYAQHSIRLVTSKLRSEGIPASQGSVVVMNPNGHVLAMVGGADDSLASRYINRAVPVSGLHCRPPASLMKMVVYTAALELGLTLESEIDASPLDYVDGNGLVYQPENHDGKTYTLLSLAEAYVNSVNTAAVRLLAEAVGFEKWFDVAQRFGLPVNTFRRELGLALGQHEVCMINMMRAYGIVASGGMDVQPQALLGISRSSGSTLVDIGGSKKARVFDRDVMRDIHYLNRMVVKNGTGRLAGKNAESLELAGKTGTSDEFKDAWFIGYTKQLVVGVWIGNDVPKTMPETYGGTSSALVFNRFINYLLKHTELVGT